MKAYGRGYINPNFLDLGTGWRWVVNFTPRPLYPRGNSPGAHWIGGWVDLKAGLDDLEKRKFLTLPGLELRPLDRPARSDYAIPAPHIYWVELIIQCEESANIKYVWGRESAPSMSTSLTTTLEFEASITNWEFLLEEQTLNKARSLLHREGTWRLIVPKRGENLEPRWSWIRNSAWRGASSYVKRENLTAPEQENSCKWSVERMF
jgi:hypothetical protein